jgi:ATP-dependent helicase/nuclease subunit A
MKHQRLLANAGSGKTHALTSRMIALLAMDADPASIAALTFTRKSAGEFVSTVFNRLAEAATDPEKLDQLRTATAQPSLDAARCRDLLARLVSRLDRLGMGTIDSLFARIARAFPLESGIAEDFTIATTDEIASARNHSLAALLASKTETDEGARAFLARFRAIRAKDADRDVFAALQRDTANLHHRYRQTPPTATWGDPVAIWGTPPPPALAAPPIATAAQALLAHLPHLDPSLNPDVHAIWEDDLAAAIAHPPHTPLTGRLQKFLVKLCKITVPKRGSTPYIPTGRSADGRLLLTPDTTPLVAALRAALFSRALETLLARSASLHGFMADFDALHQQLAGRAGILAFDDITHALATRADDGDWHHTVAWRLDQRFDHWLLDEFQDTSRPQWRVLKAFIDEVVMDPEGRRTFFYVGDTKQAIYSWRGGDVDLFDDIRAAYHPAIEDAPELDTSYRSCKPVIDLVNTVFDNLDAVATPLNLPDATLAKWQSSWRTHRVSKKTEPLAGHATWTAVPKTDGNAQDQKVAEILLATRPWECGLSCAALKRTNKHAVDLAALLRSLGIPVSLEGVSNPCVDNPLGVAVLAALRLAASPEDSLSLAIASGFPPAARWGLDTPWTFRKNLLATIAANGFSGALEALVASTDLSQDPFLRARARHLLLAASQFDARRRAQHDLAAFIDFLENHQTREPEGAGVVRVMTVHQSKGLGFDMVVVSGMDSSSPGGPSNHIALGPSADHPRWGLLLPPKNLAGEDALIAAESEKLEAAQRYEDLCNAYVALTRAKRALHVVSDALSSSTTATHFGRHLALAFANSPATFGEPTWSDDLAEPAAEPPAPPPAPFHPPTATTPRPSSPSSLTEETTSTITTHARIDTSATTLGTQVHEALAGIEWSDAPTATAPGREASTLLAAFLASPAAAEVFSRPGDDATLWRERAFDVVLDGEWFSGVFDRVVVRHHPDGRPREATIFDFKTDQADANTIATRHAAQMDIYRRAAAILLDLPADAVATRLVPIRQA